MTASPPEDVDFRQAKTLGNRLLEQLDTLRDAAPIYWSEQQQSWIVTAHRHVVEGFSGNVPLSAAGRLRRVRQVLSEDQLQRIPYMMDTVPRFLISLDPPEQLRLRRLMLKAFSRRTSEHHRAYTKAAVAQVLERAAALGEVEFVEDVARQIPGRVILRLMGLPETMYPRLQHWSKAIAGGLAGGSVTPAMLDECEAALLEVRDVLAEAVARRRTEPDGGFIAALIEAEENGERLSDAEIISTCELTLIAGNDSTTNTIALGTAALAVDPQARAFLAVNPDQAGDAIMELMRVVSMSTTQVRVAAQDFEWAGQQIHAGDHVYLMIASANRDPAVFAAPLMMDFSRPTSQNMVFGPGLHHCIGHFIAKMQLAEFFPALCQRFGHFEILDEALDWGSTLSFRGLQSLRMRLS
jgi:cytochrome P450